MSHPSPLAIVVSTGGAPNAMSDSGRTWASMSERRDRRVVTRTAALLGAAILALIAACAQPSTGPRPGPGETVGTVLYYDLEGGFYAIRGDDHATYDPVNLPADFQRNGLRVIATLRPLPGVFSIHMVGTVVEVVAIRGL